VYYRPLGFADVDVYCRTAVMLEEAVLGSKWTHIVAVRRHRWITQSWADVGVAPPDDPVLIVLRLAHHC
jgi:hypothetical protein